MNCRCRSCAEKRDAEREATGDFWSMEITSRMIVCTICGNKRCPHATSHNLPCTGSNDPGQKGSVYQ